VNGEIIGVDEKSITVKMQDGSSRIVILSEKTEINKAASGTKDDLKVGERVAVFGQENSDGSVTAQNIQLNPMFRGGPTPTP
jgi:ribosomal protein S1